MVDDIFDWIIWVVRQRTRIDHLNERKPRSIDTFFSPFTTSDRTPIESLFPAAAVLNCWGQGILWNGVRTNTDSFFRC